MLVSGSFAAFSSLAFLSASSFAVFSWSTFCWDCTIRAPAFSSSEFFFGLDHGGHHYCEFTNWMDPPNTKKKNQWTTKHRRISERLPSSQKLCPLHTCRSASFYREMDGFYILIIPSDLENIASGNTHRNVLSHPQFVGPSSDIINLSCIHTLTSKLQRHPIDSVRLEFPFLLHGSMRTKIPDFGSPYLASQTSLPNCRFPPKLLLSWNESQNLKNTRHFGEYFCKESDAR